MTKSYRPLFWQLVLLAILLYWVLPAFGAERIKPIATAWGTANGDAYVIHWFDGKQAIEFTVNFTSERR